MWGVFPRPSIQEGFVRRILTVFIVVAGLVAAVVAQDTDEIANFSAKAARVSRGQLTAASNAAKPEIVAGFLRGRHDAATVASLVTDAENPTADGPVHVRMHQRVAGLDVYGTYVKATTSRDGELLSVVENLAPAGPALLPASIDYRDALTTALQRRYPGAPTDLPEAGAADNRVEFANNGRFFENPAVTRMAIPLANGRLRIGFLVETWDRDNQLWHTVVSGNGRVLLEQLRTASDRYNVFTKNPTATPQATIAGPGVGSTESPSGWVTNNTTIGNNVDAYLDRDGTANTPDANGRPISATQDFLQAFDITTAPTTTTNQMAAVTNLFYSNNVIHDKLYRHGFNEAAGNFQTNNFGNGGAGNDPVNAEAQDGSGTSNANFATPNDGSRPRMQMYLWTQSTPNRDGDVDSDVVFHEYGHGLTWRMIGDMSGLFAGAIGEGQGDVLAIYMNNNDRVGEYSYNNALGIRRYAYTNYPLSYGDMNGRVHDDGEIYAATMWKLRSLWLSAGLTEDTLWNRMINGMNFTPSRPAYEDMRDGILAAIDAANTSSDVKVKERCQLWTAFAQFGIGQGANGAESCNFIRCTGTVTESFAVPAGVCSAPTNTAPTVSISLPANNSSFVKGTAITFTAAVSDAQGDPITTTWTSDNQAGWSATGASITTSALTTVGQHTITATASDGQLSNTASITVFITEPSQPPGGIVLQGTGYKVKSVRKVDLSWTGANGASVDVIRGSTTLVTTANSSYTDTLSGKGAGTFTYRVCPANSTTGCSNTITIVF
jgi:extracellular elastinolytic metalloproteinase